ncbi:hypothetical protein AB0E83_09095 [Streptomyces sp. NPDC035033]|uniref:hypothetical protein n=1 Tax=Streptomyces sp. NPDC035033 TaxID=3155368 RepID=UPI00340BAA7E
MARRPKVRAGTPGGRLFSGCLTVLGLLLVAVVGGMVWLETRPAREEAQARENLRESVERLRARLGEAAADGRLSDAEIAQVFPPSKPAEGVVGVTRRGEAVTVVAEVLGLGPSSAFIFVTQRSVTGGYAFDLPSPGGSRPSSRELPPEACAVRAATPPVPERPDRARPTADGEPPVRILTRRAGDGSPGLYAHLPGTLVVTDDGCVAVRTAWGDRPTAVVRGHGWSVEEENGKAAVYSPEGRLFAREGDRVGLGGGSSERFAGEPCAGDTVFEANDDQAGS